MLNDITKTSTMWKGYKGWGSTHPERETFEELYRSYEKISANSVLTYGDLIPRSFTDKYFEEVKNLDATNNVLYHKESSFKTVPLIKKYTEYQLARISSNCDHAFAILDADGKQIENIIPYDFSDAGIYNIELKTQDGNVIAWGSCDWIVDTNSSLLTFNNGVPAGISASKPPKLTFYQYVGPVGERHYIDAALFDIENIAFETSKPVVDITSKLAAYLNNIEADFFTTYKFGGTDTTQGVGLQYNLLTSVNSTDTGDVIKGYDDNSNSQVVSLLSHKEGSSESSACEVKFVSENVPDGAYTIVVKADDKEVISGYTKVNLDTGFVVVDAVDGTYNILVTTGNKATVVLLVKDNQTLDYELFYPRNSMQATIKVPVFVDLIKLPPHLKLTTLNSYSDQITPQYYGPRVADFVIASEDTESNRSADFIVYNKANFYLNNALQLMKGKHVLLRNGTYKNAEELVIKDRHLEGESIKGTVLEGIRISFEDTNVVEKIIFKNCDIETLGTTTFKDCIFDETPVNVTEVSNNAVFRDCRFGEFTNSGNATQIFDSSIVNVTQAGTLSLYNTSVVSKLFNLEDKKIDLYSSYVKEFENLGLFYINASRIEKLNVLAAEESSIISTTNIDFVENLPDSVKLDTSYVTSFSENVTRRVYPDEATVPYYSAFNRRVYAKLPKPFKYVEETNEIVILLDSIEHTLALNENGELTCTLSTEHIALAAPDNLKTQIEEVYGEHADTRLETEKPQSLEEALIELFWSKADLKDGKLPIDQLPDSVAYGGLSLVGMWSFEDNEGKYPTFADCDLSKMSDDAYTDLQNGWFFIVSASHKEDDPCYPQLAVPQEGETEAVEYTAGDWVIYTNGKFQKLDRAYLDPVYSRLPALAPVADGENVAWSIENGGTGLLNLQYKSLAEALRLINEQLLKLSPDRAASIQEIEVVIDEKKTTAELQKYIEVENGFQLNQLILEKPLECYKANGNKIVAFTQKGLHDRLPLEHAFYCGKSSTINVLDNDADVINDAYTIERFDPYKKYKLGFRSPTDIDAAEIEGTVTLGRGAYKLEHNIKYTQYDLVKSITVPDPVEFLEGETKKLTFLERKFYDFEDCSIQQCEAATVNLRVLNQLMQENRVGGYGFIPSKTKVTGSFVIKNFTKYGTISTDANVQLKAFLGELETTVEITSQYFTLTDASQEAYDLNVSFIADIPEVAYAKDSFIVKAFATNFEKETLWTNVLALNDLIVIDVNSIPSIVESAGNLIYPKLGSDIETQFGADYTTKTLGFVSQNPELVYDIKGFGWPVKQQYVETLGLFDESTYVEAARNGTEIAGKLYKFVTFKYEFPEIHDMCGFNIHLDWEEVKPKIDPIAGLFEDVVLQICATSNNLPNDCLMNANATVPVFYETTFAEGEACNYAGKSTADVRRVTFGRQPVPVKTVYVRIGIAQNSNLFIKGIDIVES